MEVVRITPRGYCHGVVDAFRIAKRVRESTDGPVYMLGHLVHNTHATDDLQRQGIDLVDPPNRLAGLDMISEGTVIFTAHGVSPQVKRRAAERGLRAVDATCSDVVRTHELVRDLASRGYEVIYVGRRGHPEPEGVLGEAPGHVHLVQDLEDVERLDIPRGRVAVTCQTTLSMWDTEEMIEAVRRRYPEVEVYNSNRLVEVVRKLGGKPAHLVDRLEDIDPGWFRGVKRVGVTSGASTPSQLTRRVIEFLEQLEPPGPDD